MVVIVNVCPEWVAIDGVKDRSRTGIGNSGRKVTGTGVCSVYGAGTGAGNGSGKCNCSYICCCCCSCDSSIATHCRAPPAILAVHTAQT
eukprot:6107854-Amphidinium_carterae.1